MILGCLAGWGLVMGVATTACGSTSIVQPPVKSLPRSGGVYAGYVATVPGTGSGSDRFTVPVLACRADAGESGVYIGVFANQAAEVTTYSFQATVAAECLDGAEYAATLVSGCAPAPASCSELTSGDSVKVKPGDVVVTSLRLSKTSTTVTVTDQSEHKTVSLSGGGGVFTHVLDGMVLGSRAEGTPMNLPLIGEFQFTQASIDDENLVAARSVALYMDYLVFARTTTGPLTPAGDAWTETYQQPLSQSG
jgi:hypothetical protein